MLKLDYIAVKERIISVMRDPDAVRIGSTLALTPIHPDLDQEGYKNHLEQTRQIARVAPGNDNRNIAIAERLAGTGMSEDMALNLVMSAINRKARAAENSEDASV